MVRVQRRLERMWVDDIKKLDKTERLWEEKKAAETSEVDGFGT